jgi:hypothetical protein
MPSEAPYGKYVGDRDAVDVLRTSLDDYRAAIARITPAKWAEPWAPGKWTVAQLMLHVVQWEMIFGYRLRCGLSVPDFVVQPLNQDPFVDAESKAVDGPTAAAAFEAVRRMNLAFAASLTPEQRRQPVTSAVRGRIDLEDLLVTLAGHPVHHLKQLQQALG